MQTLLYICFQRTAIYRFIYITAAAFFLVLTTVSGISYSFQSPRQSAVYWGELHSNIQTLNPLAAQTTEERYLRNLIFGESLFSYDPYTQNIIPGIVENFGAFAQDSLSWIIRFKDAVTFHNNTPLTPDDIKFSIETYKRYVTENNVSYNTQLDKIKEITIAGPRILEITLQKKIESLPLMLADIPILPQSYYQGVQYNQTLKNINEKRPLGYGPFQVSVVTGDSIILERYSKHYSNTSGFNRICLKLYEKPDLIKSDFIKENLVFIQIHGFLDAREISRADSAFYIIPVPASFYMVYSLVINDNNELLSSEKTRKAIKLALNKTAYPLSNYQFNVRSVAYGPVPETSWAFFKKLQVLQYNPNDSKDELYRLGWTDSNGDGILDNLNRNFNPELIYPERNVYIESLIKYIQLDLNEIGIDITARPLPPNILKDRIASKDFQLAVDMSYYYPLDIVRTFNNFFYFFNGTIGRNNPALNDAPYTLQLRRIASMPNQKDAEAIFYRLQDLYAASNVSIALTYQHHYYYAINKRYVRDFIRENRLEPLYIWKPVIK